MSEFISVENVSGLMYHAGMKDNIDSNTWEKNTLKFLTQEENYNSIRRLIRKKGDGLNDDQVDEVMDILIHALKNGADHQEDNIGERNLSLEQYVRLYAKFALKRYFTKKSKEDAKVVSKVTKDDGSEDELDLLDTIADDKATSNFGVAEVDLYDDLKCLKYKRYFFGVDIFNLLYIKVRSGFRDNAVADIVIKAIGIGESELNEAYNKAKKDPEFIDVVTDLANYMRVREDSVETILNLIGKQVYGRERLDRAFAMV